jgi:hypothetical protein
MADRLIYDVFFFFLPLSTSRRSTYSSSQTHHRSISRSIGPHPPRLSGCLLHPRVFRGRVRTRWKLGNSVRRAFSHPVDFDRQCDCRCRTRDQSRERYRCERGHSITCLSYDAHFIPSAMTGSQRVFSRRGNGHSLRQILQSPRFGTCARRCRIYPCWRSHSR